MLRFFHSLLLPFAASSSRHHLAFLIATTPLFWPLLLHYSDFCSLVYPLAVASLLLHSLIAATPSFQSLPFHPSNRCHFTSLIAVISLFRSPLLHEEDFLLLRFI